MEKMIHTYDIFNLEDAEMRKEFYDFCHLKALKSGLKCRCTGLSKNEPTLEMWGSKWQFMKYYLRTLSANKYKREALNRCISILFT